MIMKNIRRRLLSSVCVFALIANAFAIAGMAQTQGEIIVGITDPRGTIVLGANVIVTNTASGAARMVTSNDAGIYRIPALPPAIYSLRIDKGGFRSAERSGIQVQAGQAVRLDVALEVGTITETIDITAVDQADGANSSMIKGARIGGGSAFQFFSQEMSFDNNLTAGEPFSADVVSETTQTLADGTRIIQSFAGRIYRDSQGRTRTERAFRMGGTSESIQTIAIYDPVGGASYNLDPETRIAQKTEVPVRVAPPRPPAGSEVMPGLAIRRFSPPYPPIAKAARASGTVLVQILISETGEVVNAAIISGHQLLRGVALQAAHQWKFSPTMLSGRPIKIGGLLRFNFKLIAGDISAAQDARSATRDMVDAERLNNQLIEGIECNGERKITTIPVGAIGNDRPFETVSETWYSPVLGMMILSKRSDPRFGESTYRVTNINRSEPEASLFQVPADFTIKEGIKH
jgi:TonB family protein